MAPKQFHFARLFTVLVSPVVVLSITIPTDVTVTTATPQERASVTFFCNFTISNTDTELASVIWRFGPSSTHAIRIVDWRVDDPNNIHTYYRNNYSAPTYEASFEAGVDSGRSMLTIDPVRFSDEGRYWCQPVTFGYNGFGYVDIQVTPSVPSLHIYIEEGTSVEVGSKVTLYCNYTKIISDAVVRIAFTHGDEFYSSTNMANFFLYNAMFEPYYPNPRYYDPIGPPNYVMRIDGIDSELDGGWSSMTILAASEVDIRRYWCTVSFVDNTDNHMESVDLTVVDTSNVRVRVSIDGGATTVLLGSQITLTCDYTYDLAHEIGTIAWALKETENDYTPIANHIQGLPAIRYPQATYQPPNYTMMVNDPGAGQGHADLTIHAVDWVDSRGFWCFVTLMRGQGNDKNSVFISVTDTLQTQSTIITSNVATTIESSQGFEVTTERHISTFDGFLSITRVSATEIEINWDPFRSNNYNISQYRVFYQVGLSTDHSSVIFVDGDKYRILIKSLSPDTLYRIKIEADTQDGKFVSLGTIDVTTGSDKTTSINVFVVVGIPVTVLLAAIAIGLLILAAYKKRYQSKTTNTEYEEALPVDDAEYQDVLLVTNDRNKPHVYETQLMPLPPLPIDLNSASNETNASQNLQTKEYIEVYGPDHYHGNTKKHYQELDLTTMDSLRTSSYPTHESGSKYEKLSKSKATPEYLDLINPDATGGSESPTGEKPKDRDENAVNIACTTDYEVSETIPEYLEVINSEYTELQTGQPSIYQELIQTTKNESSAPEYVIHEILQEETLKLSNTDLPDATIGYNSSKDEYQELDHDTMDKPNTYQSLSKSNEVL